MRYLSVCSGIEAATVAWSPLGWQPVAFSEIDRFPNSVLAHHYPEVPNLGDMEKFNEWPRSIFDVLAGGTPCQSFSIAGLRGGLADPRGNLALGFIGVLARFRPRWFVWENVPGAFSSVSHYAPDPSPPEADVGLGPGKGSRITHDQYDADEDHAFACMLAGFSELGYGWAYRVLDAQYFGVPQRRRRIFVVGHSGAAWQRAAAVLFERNSLRRHPPPRRKTRQDVAGTVGASSTDGGRRTTDLDWHGAYIPEIIPQAMNAKWHKGSSGPAGDEHHNMIAEAYQCHGDNVGPMGTLRGGHNEISGVPFTFDETQITSPENRSDPQPGDPANTIPSHGRPPSVAYSITPESGQGADLRATETDLGHSLGTSRNERGTRILDSRVRRLTPLECERLMGFPDGYTDVPGASDSARYRALGNSIPIPVLRWIGDRLAIVDAIKS